MRVFSLIYFTIVFCLSANLEARTWTSLDGKTMEAEFVKADKGKVTVKRSDGKTFSVDLKKFSEADRKFVEQKLAESTAGEKDEEDKITGKIRSPRDGEKVVSGFAFKGMTRGAPKGYVAMLFTRNVGAEDFHPRARGGELMEANRTINRAVHHGPTDFGEWSLHLYVLPVEHAQKLADWCDLAGKLAQSGKKDQIKAWDKALLDKATEVASVKYFLKPK